MIWPCILPPGVWKLIFQHFSTFPEEELLRYIFRGSHLGTGTSPADPKCFVDKGGWRSLAGIQARLRLNSQCAGRGVLLQPTLCSIGSLTSCSSLLPEYTTRFTLTWPPDSTRYRPSPESQATERPAPENAAARSGSECLRRSNDLSSYSSQTSALLLPWYKQKLHVPKEVVYPP